MRKQISTISFFCGCGGLDLGFVGGFEYKDIIVKRLPFKILNAYDNDEKCIETYKTNISERAEVMDLRNYDPSQMLKADLLIGGFPCQDFATCGPRRGLTSDRGRLYQAMLKYMRYHKPRVVVGENVPGLAHIHDGDILETIKSDIEKEGYHVKIWTMFAPDYGIPQRRTRLIIVCVRDDVSDYPKEPERIFSQNDYRSTKWAIGDLETIIDNSIPNQGQFFRASRAKRGNGQGDERNPADAPAYTIRANAKSRVQFHYILSRRLTVRECARIQSFPDTFIFPHSATTNVRQIGNAVPPLLGNLIAQSIYNFMKGLK